MKKENPAHFELVKIQNRKLIRNLLRRTGSLSIARAAQQTGLSYPTVSALLRELTETGEVRVSEETESCGGRPGICYELNRDYQYAWVLYFNHLTLCGEIHDACGHLVKRCEDVPVTQEIGCEEIIQLGRRMKAEYPSLRAVSLGIPGVVYETEITYLPKFPHLQGRELAERLRQELNLEVFIENDINAITFSETDELDNFAHIVYVEEDGCIGVGIAMDGRLVKGAHGFAGELEYLCPDMRHKEDTFVTSILALTCVLNLPVIRISGGSDMEQMLSGIEERLRKQLPEDRIPELQVMEELQGKYEKGLLKCIFQFFEEQE